MTSEATVISKPPSRGTPCAVPPSPSTMLRSARSFMSTTRFQRMRRVSRPSALPWDRWLSSIAASKLWAAPIACMSPVKCRLMSSIGATCARPPPAAPPFMPKTGPSDGSRSATIERRPILRKPSASPTVVVDLPSPAGVGVIAVTSTSAPSGRFASRATASQRTLALRRP